MEAPVGVEPTMELLQSSALPLGYGAFCAECPTHPRAWLPSAASTARGGEEVEHPVGLEEIGAGNGIRTRDFDLGKVALYH